MGTPRAAPHGRRSTQSTRTTSLNGSGVQRPIVVLRTAPKGPATFETRRSRRRRVRPRPPLPRSRMVANCSEEEAMAHTKLVIGTTKRRSPTAPVRTALADGRRARGGGDLEGGLFTHSLRHLLVLSVLSAALAASSAAAPERPALHFKVFARTGIRLTNVVWTGSRFLYVENTTNAISAAGPAGTPVRKFASLPEMSEETRCAVSPGGHSFPAHRIYGHTPDNKIYQLSGNGKRVSVLATLPNTSQSDGALVFDTVGRFGYRLVAATGRSGHSKPAGGAVYTIGATSHVRFVGNYAGPGGSDEIAIAPRGFGAVAGGGPFWAGPRAPTPGVRAKKPRAGLGTPP